MQVAQVKIVVGGVVPSWDAEAEQVEVGRQNNWRHRGVKSGLFVLPGLTY